MQYSPTEIKEKLLKAVDKEYNVVDMAAVVEVISILERTTITKVALQTTRLGKLINELRRKTKNESLAKRAKDLVRRWRDMILPTAESDPVVVPGQQYNGANSTSNSGAVVATSNRLTPASKRLSPGLPLRGNISPGLPNLGRHLSRSAAVSPALSLPSSDRSNTSPRPKSRSSTPRPLDNASTPSKPSATASTGQDSVPKTHASNKRLRKDDSSDNEPPKKVKRPNGLSTEPLANANSVTRPDLTLSAECSQDSFSALSEHGSNSDISEIIKPVPTSEVTMSEDVLEPKKRGRKKGSKNKSRTHDLMSDSREDIVKAKIASIGRTHRVKTTQELLADIQARNLGLPSDNVMLSVTENKASLANCLLTGARGGVRDDLEMSRNKTEHIAKFLRSQSDLELSNQEFPCSRDDPKDSNVLCKEDLDPSDAASIPSGLSKDIRSPAESNSRDELVTEQTISVPVLEVHSANSQSPRPGGERTAEEILSRLPPIDVNAIEWEESVSEPPSPEVRQITDDDVTRLHTQHIEGVNGNYNQCGQLTKDDGATDFREWHETMSRTSYQGELLHILPYVVID